VKFYLVDDDITARAMLKEIIEDHELGVVIGETSDGAHITSDLHQADILLIDLLMPTRDGIETVRDLQSTFSGKIIMISQVVSKNMISLAYAQRIEYYITKPLNKFEIVSVIKKVIEKIQLEQSIQNIHQLTSTVSNKTPTATFIENQASQDRTFSESILYILGQIGIIGENGYKDIADMLSYIYSYEQTHTFQEGFPNLKEVYAAITKSKMPNDVSEQEVNKEIKSTEQRVRRAIDQSLNHLASLGLTDYLHPTFEKYASKLFNFTVVRERMTEMKQDKSIQVSNVQVSTRKFLQSLYFEVKHDTI